MNGEILVKQKIEVFIGYYTLPINDAVFFLGS